MVRKLLIKAITIAIMTLTVRIVSFNSCIALERRPNILFIMTDDQGPWTLSAQNHPNTYTPEIDRLAKEGVILKNAYTQSAICSPSRASLISGRYCSETGVLDWIRQEAETGLDTSLVTWPNVLRNAGYHTALVGKWHLGDEKHYMPTQRGYDYFTGFPHGGMKSKSPDVLVEGNWKTFKGEYTPDVLTDFTMDYIREFQDEPFAISLNYWAPHANTDFPEGFQPPYDDRSWLPLKDEDLKHWRDMDLKLPNPDFPNLDVQRVKRMMREYYAAIHSVDRNIGRLMKLLDELNLSKNTIVIFTSDHGYMMGHHGLWHKGNGRWITTDRRDPFGLYENGRPNLYDYSLKVPCVIRWPDVIEPGTKIEETIESIDWFPTILSMAKVKKPQGLILRGDNFLPLLKGKKIPWDNSLYVEYKSLRAYRSNEWKLVRHLNDPEKDELYHLAIDPQENINIIHKPGEKIKRIIQRLDQKMTEQMKKLEDPLLNKMQR